MVYFISQYFPGGDLFSILYSNKLTQTKAAGIPPNQDEYSPPLGTEGYSEVLTIDSTIQGYPLGIAVSKVKSKGAWTREPFVSRLVEIGLLPEPSNVSRHIRLT